MGDFGTEISQWCDKAGKNCLSAARTLTMYAYTMLVERSPIDTGRFRASWRIGIDQIDDSVEPPRFRKHKEAGNGGSVPPTTRQIAYAKRQVKQITKSGEAYVTNSLPYAWPLEEGRSPQNSHFLELTMSELEVMGNRLSEGDLDKEL